MHNLSSPHVEEEPIAGQLELLRLLLCHRLTVTWIKQHFLSPGVLVGTEPSVPNNTTETEPQKRVSKENGSGAVHQYMDCTQV